MGHCSCASPKALKFVFFFFIYPLIASFKCKNLQKWYYCKSSRHLVEVPGHLHLAWGRSEMSEAKKIKSSWNHFDNHYAHLKDCIEMSPKVSRTRTSVVWKIIQCWEGSVVCVAGMWGGAPVWGDSQGMFVKSWKVMRTIRSHVWLHDEGLGSVTTPNSEG